MKFHREPQLTSPASPAGFYGVWSVPNQTLLSQSVLIFSFTGHPHLRRHSALPGARDGKLQLTGLVGLSQLISVGLFQVPDLTMLCYLPIDLSAT